jgi:hypothetical protein
VRDDNARVVAEPEWSQEPAETEIEYFHGYLVVKHETPTAIHDSGWHYDE